MCLHVVLVTISSEQVAPPRNPEPGQLKSQAVAKARFFSGAGKAGPQLRQIELVENHYQFPFFSKSPAIAPVFDRYPSAPCGGITRDMDRAFLKVIESSEKTRKATPGVKLSASLSCEDGIGNADEMSEPQMRM